MISSAKTAVRGQAVVLGARVQRRAGRRNVMRPAAQVAAQERPPAEAASSNGKETIKIGINGFGRRVTAFRAQTRRRRFAR